MRLYRATDGRWFGTQADARKGAGKEWSEIEVPTDKSGLLAWLNTHEEALHASSARVLDAVCRSSAEAITAERREPPKLVLNPPAAVRHDATTNRFTRLAQEHERNPGSMIETGLLREIVWSLDLSEALEWAEIALKRIRKLTEPAPAYDFEQEGQR